MLIGDISTILFVLFMLIGDISTILFVLFMLKLETECCSGILYGVEDYIIRAKMH
jgi:hypothetical protein